ncbi:enoyl-CoA hydratase-related protein [Gordonia sp. KTR9]|uniref:enoyl-CoA hydratase-related protein n=1 Tax=Gordonia sp. KTR9 TaxID=337191 RepID=UPI00027DDC16|nr:enoyl-CoA hydratase-related protein [Gordonia sp. KTR9]AFR48201.1 Enoyl-CoA hydratase / carnithine racemase [Gordonia sp. KTR9]
MKQVLYDVADGVATISLNRPDQLNAVTTVMCDELIAAFDLADSDDSVRAIIVTGVGRAFCAGADLSSGADAFEHATDGGDSSAGVRRDSGGRVTLRIFASLKPVIAAINGSAVGFGLSLTLPMDIRVVADSAKLGLPFTARGIVPDGASSWFLPKAVGLSRAIDWSISGRIFRADEALSSGLVQSAHPANEVLDAARQIANSIAKQTAPVSVALTRQMLWQMSGASHPMTAHEIESAALTYTGASRDAAEGVTAFLDKRSPKWSMRPSDELPAWFPWADEPPFNDIAQRSR